MFRFCRFRTTTSLTLRGFAAASQQPLPSSALMMSKRFAPSSDSAPTPLQEEEEEDTTKVVPAVIVEEGQEITAEDAALGLVPGDGGASRLTTDLATREADQKRGLELIHDTDLGQLTTPLQPDAEKMQNTQALAVEIAGMKRAHSERPSPLLAQQARRMLFTMSISGQDVDSGSVSRLLSTAVYFGMGSDSRLVKECLEYVQKNNRLIEMESVPQIVSACSVIKSRVSREVIEAQAVKAARNAKYLDPTTITGICNAFAKVQFKDEKLFDYLSKRVQVLAKVGELEAGQLVVIAHAFSRLRIKDKTLFSAIAKRAMHLRERVTVNELVPLIVAFSKIGLKDAQLSKRFASKAMEYVDQMNASHVAQLFQAFAYFGIRYDQLFGVLTNRAVELIDEFTATYIADTLNAFQRISINNPELFDNLAERALAVVEDHDARDIARTITALAHFGLKDEELFRRLASHAASIGDEFEAMDLCNTVHSFARTNFLQEDIAVALSERSVVISRRMDAGQARRCLWSFSKFGVRDPSVLGPIFNRALSLHQEFFDDPAGTEELEEIFEAYGQTHCQQLYALYLARLSN